MQARKNDSSLFMFLKYDIERKIEDDDDDVQDKQTDDKDNMSTIIKYGKPVKDRSKYLSSVMSLPFHFLWFLKEISWEQKHVKSLNWVLKSSLFVCEFVLIDVLSAMYLAAYSAYRRNLFGCKRPLPVPPNMCYSFVWMDSDDTKEKSAKSKTISSSVRRRSILNSENKAKSVS